MAVIKMKNSKNTCSNIKDYLEKGKGENRVALKSTFNIIMEDNWASEMEHTKIIHDKTNGRQYYHIIQSFSNEQGNENYNLETIHECGVELIRDFEEQGYQVAVITHNDTDNLHNHIVINSVNSMDGKKLQLSKNDIKKIHEKNDTLCMERGLETLTESKQRKDERDRRNGKQPTSRKTDEIYLKKSFKETMRERLQRVFSNRSIVDSQTFNKALADENMKISRVTEKTITYMDENGNKARGKTLGGFTLNDISNLIQRNKERMAKKVVQAPQPKVEQVQQPKVVQAPQPKTAQIEQEQIRSIEPKMDKVNIPNPTQNEHTAQNTKSEIVKKPISSPKTEQSPDKVLEKALQANPKMNEGKADWLKRQLRQKKISFETALQLAKSDLSEKDMKKYVASQEQNKGFSR